MNETTADSFLSVFAKINEFKNDPDHWNYEQMFNSFVGLGKMLGFTWDQIELAYIEKNTENHNRQDREY
ncbi:dUTPase [compost metagenome]